MGETEKTIFEDIDIFGEMKNTQTTPYTFIRNTYNAIKCDQLITAKLWIEHAEKFRSFFKDNPREEENFQSVLLMANDYLLIIKKIEG
ncbi:MAG: hypothetical protein JXN64_13290 [Spirochaetes bacterium]|nr:hypothetical protein [Spirochaetota bacterium]